MPKVEKNMSYTTQNELTFIKGLGSFSQCGAVKMKSVSLLLWQYIKAAQARDNWGAVNADVCIDYAYARIAEINGKRG